MGSGESQYLVVVKFSAHCCVCHSTTTKITIEFSASHQKNVQTTLNNTPCLNQRSVKITACFAQLFCYMLCSVMVWFLYETSAGWGFPVFQFTFIRHIKQSSNDMLLWYQAFQTIHIQILYTVTNAFLGMCY